MHIVLFFFLLPRIFEPCRLLFNHSLFFTLKLVFSTCNTLVSVDSLVVMRQVVRICNLLGLALSYLSVMVFVGSAVRLAGPAYSTVTTPEERLPLFLLSRVVSLHWSLIYSPPLLTW